VSNLLKKEKGFTLIEIVLVMAIAGLIMVIVFLALSGAQKSRRDTQRKNDNARFLSQLESYASNNNGSYPTGWNVAPENFWTDYQPSNFKDPSKGATYAQGSWTNGNTVGACNNNPGTINVEVNGRTVTTRMCLEQGFQDLTNQ